MGDDHAEMLNLYDQDGRIVGEAPRAAAKASGLAVGAVNALILGPNGRVLLQRRPADKENGGLWDKSVGGHVSAGEEFDQALLREAGEELFDDPHAPALRLAADAVEFAAWRERLDPADTVLLRRVALQLNLRDVRRAPDASLRSVTYHVAVYLGLTGMELTSLRPQSSEIAALRYASPTEVDQHLLAGELAPNMAFLWLTQARTLLALDRAHGAGPG